MCDITDSHTGVRTPESSDRRQGFARVRGKNRLRNQGETMADRPESVPAPRDDRHPTLTALALAMSIFGASMAVAGRTLAQTLTHQDAIAAVGLQGFALRMEPQVRAEVETALRRMTDSELRLTYARIHATFRAFLGHDDLSVARALLDYATLTQAELDRRNLSRPEGTESAAGMGIAYELVL
jgi:hypothetical protein